MILYQDNLEYCLFDVKNGKNNESNYTFNILLTIFKNKIIFSLFVA